MISEEAGIDCSAMVHQTSVLKTSEISNVAKKCFNGTGKPKTIVGCNQNLVYFRFAEKTLYPVFGKKADFLRHIALLPEVVGMLINCSSRRHRGQVSLVMGKLMKKFLRSRGPGVTPGLHWATRLHVPQPHPSRSL